MLTAEDNEKLTRVGPGTPMGELLRRYWHPVAAAVELRTHPTKRVRILCEDLVLFKDRQGNIGLIEERCAHRRVNLYWGIPEEHGLRCPYHGWLYDEAGRCLEQPGEPTGSTFKDRIQLTAYPIQELGGLIFAYLGPQPAPLPPRYDLFAWDNAVREIGSTMLPCNWLQCMENSLDPIHLEWLHGYFGDYLHRLHGRNPGREPGRHTKIGFDVFEHGIIKRRVYEGQTEECDDWRIGHPIVFPNMLRGGSSFQIRVPIDDTHTWHILYNSARPGIPVPPQDEIPLYQLPRLDGDGEPALNYTLGQDYLAWVEQGNITERQFEHLGVSDIGVILYRELLLEQIARVERGEDPMEVYRDPAENQMIVIPTEVVRELNTRNLDPAARAIEVERRQENEGENRLSQARMSPLAAQLRQYVREAAHRAASGQPLLPEIPVPTPQIVDKAHREAVLRP